MAAEGVPPNKNARRVQRSIAILSTTAPHCGGRRRSTNKHPAQRAPQMARRGCMIVQRHEHHVHFHPHRLPLTHTRCTVTSHHPRMPHASLRTLSASQLARVLPAAASSSRPATLPQSGRIPADGRRLRRGGSRLQRLRPTLLHAAEDAPERRAQAIAAAAVARPRGGARAAADARLASRAEPLVRRSRKLPRRPPLLRLNARARDALLRAAAVCGAVHEELVVERGGLDGDGRSRARLQPAWRSLCVGTWRETVRGHGRRRARGTRDTHAGRQPGACR